MYKSFSVYFYYFTQFLKARMSYRWDFIASLFSAVLVSSSGLLFVILLIDGKNVTELRGWTREEVLFIYGYSMMATGLFNVLARNLYQFGDRYVIQGEFDRILLRPLNSLFQVIFESFHLEALGTFILGLGVFLYTSSQLSMEFQLFDIIWLIVSVLSGVVIFMSVFIILASLSFHFEDRVGIAPPIYNMIQFGRYPLTIFSSLIQFILRWVIPFGFVAFYPATHFFSREGFELYCYITPLIACFWVIITGILWRFGALKYSSTGN